MNLTALFPILLNLISRGAGGEYAAIIKAATELLQRVQAVLPPPAKPVPDVSTMRGIQEALAQLGFSPGAIDGEIGDRTKAAVKAFQQRWNSSHAGDQLVVDGWPGGKTQAALAQALQA